MVKLSQAPRRILVAAGESIDQEEDVVAAEPGFATGRTLIVAFEGWNDAGEAASRAAIVLRDATGAVPRASIDAEEYFDYQFTRPTVRRTEDGTTLSWPQAAFSGPAPLPGARRRTQTEPETGLYFLIGTEPSHRWRAFTEEVLALVQELQIDEVVLLGAMLADVPHTRPISLFCTSENPSLRARLDLSRSSYEGPVGVLSVLNQRFEEVGIPTLSIWASVPHYVQHSPSPKATLALVQKLESLLGMPIPPGELPAESAAWEQNLDTLASEDEEMGGYISQLEKARDTVDSPAASGDAIAEEFERYLRRHDDDDPRRAG